MSRDSNSEVNDVCTTVCFGAFAGICAAIDSGIGMWIITIPIGAISALIGVVPFMLYFRSHGLRRLWVAYLPCIVLSFGLSFLHNPGLSFLVALGSAVLGLLGAWIVDLRQSKPSPVQSAFEDTKASRVTP